MLRKLSICLCLVNRMQDRYTKWRQVINPLKEWNNSSILVKPWQIKISFMKLFRANCIQRAMFLIPSKLFVFQSSGSTSLDEWSARHRHLYRTTHNTHNWLQPDVQACTNCAVQLIKCCSWWWTNDSPKHVEPFNEKIKNIHKNLCISLVYIHSAIWCTVYTPSNS